MRKVLIVLIWFCCGAIMVSAQKNCNGLPCGPIPWTLPRMPALQSPTPMPTYAVTALATDVSGAVPTPAAMPTNPPLSDVDTSGIADQMATLAAMVEATPEILLDASGTPIAIGTAELTGAETFFAYSKGLSTINLGSISPLFTLLVSGAVTIIAVKLTTFLLPILVSLFGIIRKIIQLVLDFLPFSILVIPFQDGTLTPWPTPTPRVYIEATPAFSLPNVPSQMAEEAVQGWHFANQEGTLDTMVTIAMLILVIGGLYTIIAKVKEL